MTYQAWREEFCARLAREFPDLSPTQVQAKMARIVRDSNRIQSHAVNICNRDVSVTDEMRAERARARIAAEFPHLDPLESFEFHGDPRGPCARVRLQSVLSMAPDDFTPIPSRDY